MLFRKSRLHFGKRSVTARDVVGRELLLGVWRINLSPNVQHYAHSYITHCNELRSLFAEDGLCQANRTEIVELVKLVKLNQDRTVKEIKDEIGKANFKWVNQLAGDDSIQNVLDFAVRLWLFIEPDLSDQTLTLPKVVERCLPPRMFQSGGDNQKSEKCGGGSKANPRTSSFGLSRHLQENDEASIYLPADFCEKSLTRKGAIKLEWSSYLSDHLTLTGKSRLRVFRHASAIQQNSRPSTRDSAISALPYPPKFLHETERTLALLFDPTGNTTSKRTRRLEKKHHVDLEAAIHTLIHSDDRLDLRTYPFWQERLREICKVYEAAQPKTLRQWWFDRRDRFNWATFWAAFVVFCLTLVFGVISAVTGIMQVYASFRTMRA
jgi:hypothetical protein